MALKKFARRDVILPAAVFLLTFAVALFSLRLLSLNQEKDERLRAVYAAESTISRVSSQLNRYLAESEYCNAVMAGVPEDDLIRAAQNYADACWRDRTAERYIKKPENWLRENVFMQYLKGVSNGADGTNAGENTTAHEKSINERLGELGDTGEFEGF